MLTLPPPPKVEGCAPTSHMMSVRATDTSATPTYYHPCPGEITTPVADPLAPPIHGIQGMPHAHPNGVPPRACEANLPNQLAQNAWVSFHTTCKTAPVRPFWMVPPLTVVAMPRVTLSTPRDKLYALTGNDPLNATPNTLPSMSA